MARLVTILALATLALLPGTAPAFAHKLKVFATAIGTNVEGRAYFVGGGAASNVPVALNDSTGAVAGTARTHAPDGTFSLTLPYLDDFTITADAQDGHVAKFTLAAARLSKTLPVAPHLIVAESPPTPDPGAGTAEPEAASSADIDAIEQAVARQVAPLADQIDTMQATIGFRDVLGGVGFVLGIFGLWSLLARRRKTP
jgi:nickel transport protein